MKRRTYLPESIALDRKPPGWIIRVDATDDGLLLQWPMSGTAVQNVNLFVARILLPFLVCAWLAAGWTAYNTPLPGQRTPIQTGFWIAIWLLLLLWAIYTGIALYKPGRPEAIWLAEDCFGYEPGSMCPAIYGRDYSPAKHWRYIFSTPVRKVIDKARLSKFELVRTDNVQRLSFQHDLETVEIGHCLCESERKWLFTVLEHWRTGDVAAYDMLPLETPVIDAGGSTAIVANRSDVANRQPPAS